MAALGRVIVCGSRSWTDKGAIRARLMLLDPNVVIVHGKCPKGADALADEVAREMGFEIEAHPADWMRRGKRAGHVRNAEMAALGADLVIAFWDGQSRGTTNMMDNAAYFGIPYEIIRAS